MRTFAWCGAAVAAVLIAATMIAAPAGSSLLDAAESGDRATALRLLAEKGTNPNAAGADGTTPIMWAAHNDDLALVQALIKAGAEGVFCAALAGLGVGVALKIDDGTNRRHARLSVSSLSKPVRPSSRLIGANASGGVAR